MKVPAAPRVDPATQELMNIFSDRLTRILDQRPDVVMPGRSRTNDFAAKFNIHYATAHRLLNAKSLPSVDLLCSIAQTLGVTESWLLGRGDDRLVNPPTGSVVQIEVYNPTALNEAAFITIPSEVLPPNFDTRDLLVARARTELGDWEYVIARLNNAPQEGRVHLLYDPANGITYLRRINLIQNRGELLCATLETAAMETVKLSDVVIGDKHATSTLSILGPVVARLKFGFKGD